MFRLEYGVLLSYHMYVVMLAVVLDSCVLDSICSTTLPWFRMSMRKEALCMSKISPGSYVRLLALQFRPCRIWTLRHGEQMSYLHASV